MTNAQGSPAQIHTPTNSPMPISYKSSHAMDAHKASYTDIVKSVARLPHCVDRRGKVHKGNIKTLIFEKNGLIEKTYCSNETILEVQRTNI